jgi:hypothetical protein
LGKEFTLKLDSKGEPYGPKMAFRLDIARPELGKKEQILFVLDLCRCPLDFLFCDPRDR